MAMGMPYELFWDGDPTAVKQFRQAYDLKLEQENSMLWLQGRYIYDALLKVYPAFNALTKTNKIEPYGDPYPITKKGIRDKEEEEAKARMERIRLMLVRAERKEQDKGK